MQNISFHLLRQDHWSFHLYLSQCYLLHNLHSSRKAMYPQNGETIRRSFLRTPLWRKEKRQQHTLIGREILVFYHLPKKSGNFGWNVSGKTIFFFSNGNFHETDGISWKVVQNSQTEFPNENARSICLFLLVPDLLAWIVFVCETTKVIKDGFANVPVRSVWAFGAWYGSSLVSRVCWWSFATIRWVIWVKYALCSPE